MTVHVSDNSERVIRFHVQSGRFATESEVIDAALRLLNQSELEPAAKKPLSEDEFKQQLMATGLMASLPTPLDPAKRRDFQPVSIDGEPLSETIIRERR
jgi:putative addiction module CopG family antidote